MKYLLAIITIVFVSVSYAKAPSQNFNDWKKQFIQRALSAGINHKIIDEALSGIKPDKNILKLDTSQPEFSKQIWQYLDRATAKKRVKKGIKLIQKHHYLLNKIEQDYNVPKEIIVAIWAMESEFGANYGNSNVVRSLATLAHQGKRAEFAEQELLASLTIYQQREINRLQIKLCYAHGLNKQLIGSWAGAMGQGQFMPSSYLKFAVDYDRDGRRDLWQSLPDVFASIANFLKEAGWNNQTDWGWEVRLPNEFDWLLNIPENHLSLADWKKSGVQFVTDMPDYESVKTGLFIPAGKIGPVFLMTDNFEVIRTYNKSSSYALAVAQLSRLFTQGDEIKAGWPRKDKPLSFHQKEELQVLLSTAGFDAGKVDGKIGENTKRAIHNWQLEQGMPADGYASKSLLKQLRQTGKPQ